MILNWINRCLF